MITALTIGIAIVVDFVLLPALLIRFDTREYSSSESPAAINMGSEKLIEYNTTATKQKLAFEEK